VADILFAFEIDAPPESVIEALTTSAGIESFWTSRAKVPADVGETLELGFAIAPLPFDLRLEQSDERTVVWRTLSFPPHWVGTTVRWDVADRDGGSSVAFRHAGFGDDTDAGHAGFTWGQIMVRLKHCLETGTSDPVFA
jgi:uncharacterized protein YndB with AHSA1/START domain